ncbi:MULTISPECIES: nitrogenase component 1 [unclassified Adlercreutzia]|uniref:nitrogenase component 1 n=1 Tax=unclassified Adlercreutzia TaxID=2636013 RepID=UPI0013EA2978|nr:MULTISPECIES: nitrogenase component 1 [unclassified Adlercreutzia]
MQLSRFLPPFASDYSGAASVLSGCDAQLVFVDPGCCSYSFLEAEGVRSDDAERPVLSAHLRTVDTVLGADEALTCQVSAALRRSRPRLAALLGTPVPSLVGMDLPGLARQIAAEAAVPVVGIETDGFAGYDVGVRRVYEAALRLCDASSPQHDRGSRQAGAASGRQSGTDDSAARDASKPRAALVGFNPFDFGSSEAVRAVMRFVEDGGWTPTLPFGAEHAEAEDLACCKVALVGSESGLELARALEARFDIPFLCWSPACFGHDMGELAAIAAKGDPYAFLTASSCACGEPSARVLVVAEQLSAHALAHEVARRAHGVSVATASFFTDERATRRLGTIELDSEERLAALLAQGACDVLVADPLLLRLPEARGMAVVPWPHRAVSGKLYDRCSDKSGWESVCAQTLNACARLA